MMRSFMYLMKAKNYSVSIRKIFIKVEFLITTTRILAYMMVLVTFSAPLLTKNF